MYKVQLWREGNCIDIYTGSIQQALKLMETLEDLEGYQPEGASALRYELEKEEDNV